LIDVGGISGVGDRLGGAYLHEMHVECAAVWHQSGCARCGA
jgi:hypothetical protein